MSKNRGRDRNIDVKKSVKHFANEKWEKFKKKNKGCYSSKKEMKFEYYYSLLDDLPDVIDFFVKFGYLKNEEVQQLKQSCYDKLVDKDFIKVIKKVLKDDDEEIKNIKLLPIIIKDILQITERENRKLLAEDPNAKTYDLSDLVELSKMILKKRLKKMEKAGIESNMAFDLLSIIPCEKALGYSQKYRIHMVYNSLYEHSKTKTIPFANIMKVLVSRDYYPAFIAFALLERKEKFGDLTDSQKTFYLQVSTWIFDTMEKELSRGEIEAIIRTFVGCRRKDESQGRDTNRRYALSTLSKDDYPKINKVLDNMVSADDTIKKYL